MNIPDFNDSWAKVELYRWEHGELPLDDETCKPLNVPVALEAMAKAIEDGCKNKDVGSMPSPFNVCSVLRYVAKNLPKEIKSNEAHKKRAGGKVARSKKA